MSVTPFHETARVAPVTAVIPCYNCASSLERAVSSVAAQTVQPAELILVDDASTDSTRKVMAKVRDRYGSDWVRTIALERNSGPATARNAAWNAAHQPFVAFLDADDAWHSKKIEAQIAYMQAHPNVVLTAHAFKLVGPNGGLDSDGTDATLRGVRNVTCRSLLVSNRIATRTVMLKRDLPYRFRDGKRYAEDYLLWLQVACDGHRIEVFDADWAYIFKSDFGEGGLSARMLKMVRGEIEAFWQLAKDRRLVRPVAFICSVHAFLKYLRRLGIVAVKNARLRLRGC